MLGLRLLLRFLFGFGLFLNRLLLNRGFLVLRHILNLLNEVLNEFNHRVLHILLLLGHLHKEKSLIEGAQFGKCDVKFNGRKAFGVELGKRLLQLIESCNDIFHTINRFLTFKNTIFDLRKQIYCVSLRHNM